MQCVLAITVLPDGKIVSGCRDSNIKVWETYKDAAVAERYNMLRTLSGHTGVSSDVILLRHTLNYILHYTSLCYALVLFILLYFLF